MTTIQKPRRRYTTGPIDTDLLLPPGCSILPPGVDAAQQAFLEPKEALLQASHEFQVAKADLRRAPMLDREAARAAADVGKPMPAPMTPKFQKAYDEAERKVGAARGAAQGAMIVGGDE